MADFSIGFLLGDFAAGILAVYLVKGYAQSYDTTVAEIIAAIAAGSLVNYLWMQASMETGLLHAGIAGVAAWFLFPYVLQIIFGGLTAL